MTFWDAGEFIAAAKVLGIPHPPGTPLFVLMANVWTRLLPIGGFAWRTNLLSAVCSAAGAMFFFLLLAGTRDTRPGRYVSAAGAALVAAFVFTVWQNSNETEVYTVATLSIAAICWLALQWRAARGTTRASNLLLLCVYILAVSLGNHLLALLAGPALIGFIAHVLMVEPARDPKVARAEWAEVSVIAGCWALLLGTGLGSPTLLIVGGIAFLVAAGYAGFSGSGAFATAALLVGAVGVSTYLFLYLRAAHHPLINEADPSTWASLKAVISREQYPVRSPFDNPTQFHGPENTHRSVSMIGWQIVNYLQYFDWQWANGLAPTRPVFAVVRLPFTMIFASLGFYGAGELRRRDRSVFWLLMLLFLTTGPALVAYMNFKPGASLLWNVYSDPEMHEVRERDYFFTVSFQVWGLFAGLGIAAVYRRIRAELPKSLAPGPWPLAPALLPFLLNFRAASRAHGPDALLARDFAYDLLQSAEPYGILFTNGDNDTFPLWYLQAAEGFRQDVSVINLSLANTPWFIRQMRDNPVHKFRPDQAPHFAALAPPLAPPALHPLSDRQIDSMRSQLLPQDLLFQLGRIRQVFPKDMPFYVKDGMTLWLIKENYSYRPIYWSTTVATENWLGLGRFMSQEALVVRLHVEPADSSHWEEGILGAPLDVPRSDTLAWSVYRYAGLLAADSLDLDATSAGIAANLSFPFFALGQAYESTGDRERSVRNLRRAYHLSPTPQLGRYLDSVSRLTPGALQNPPR